MKLILAVLLFVGLPLLAQDAAKEPEALTKAREKYQKEIARVTAPVLKDYLAKLEALKKDLGAKGEIEAAMTVQREMDRVTPQAPANDPPIVGTWTFGPYGVAQFNADGTTKHGSNTGKWVETKKGAYRLTWANGMFNDLTPVTKDKFRTLNHRGEEIFIIRQ